MTATDEREIDMVAFRAACAAAKMDPAKALQAEIGNRRLTERDLRLFRRPTASRRNGIMRADDFRLFLAGHDIFGDREAARIFGVSRQTMHHWRAKPDTESIDIGADRLHAAEALANERLLTLPVRQ